MKDAFFEAVVFDAGFLHSYGSDPLFKWIVFPEPVVAKHILFIPMPGPDGGFTTAISGASPYAECLLMGWFDFLVTDYGDSSFPMPV